MRVLAFDPGGERMGWACVEGGEKDVESKCLGSGLLGLERGVKDYQPYRLSLMAKCVWEGRELLDTYKPDVVVSEIVPPVGGGPSNLIQRQLALSAVCAVQAVAVMKGYELDQVGATTVKRDIGGKKSATKVAVRNGVIRLIPALASRKSDWVKIFDEPDAIAVALTHMGYKNG